MLVNDAFHSFLIENAMFADARYNYLILARQSMATDSPEGRTWCNVTGNSEFDFTPDPEL